MQIFIGQVWIKDALDVLDILNTALQSSGVLCKSLLRGCVWPLLRSLVGFGAMFSMCWKLS